MSERYELEELVIDDSFVNYCFRRQEADVARWEAYLRQYPDEAATMAEAREMVLGISVMFWETQPVPVRKPFPLRRTLAVAASIAVIVLAGYWLLQPARQPVAVLAAKPEVFITLLAEKKTVRLPDSSTVILNAGSELRLDSGFGNGHRRVHLKGEALFDVRPDAEKPFIVKVEDYDVKVLGTVFNVKSYPGDKNSETSLLSGKVEIQLANQKSAFKVLHPKEKFVIDKAAAAPAPGEATAADDPKVTALQTAIRPLSYNRSQVNVETAWSENRLVIENETFGDIREKLERWFDVSIQFDDKAIEAYRFTATFEKENIVQVLNALQASYSFTFTKQGRSIRISR
jgi:ferric-dicitrate binding protein FerR (iron transport regulator)